MALKVGELYASFGIDSSDLGKALSGIEKQCEQAAKTLSLAGAGLTLAVTTPLVNIGKDILQSSIDFESAFAGVKKTVDSDVLKEAGMSYEMLSDALKRMTLEAPQTADALAGIMEAGGQLGIDVTALEGFTKTIAALGVATNMTTDEAASMFAKFANITGMSQTEFENLGSTIVALGNNFATTENDIMTMAMRMASAGTTIGMTETDILAFATAMSSVGIMAEVGGSSFSTFASNLSLAVATSSDDLKTYASIAGMSAEQFKTAFEQDAASAINTFIQGLNDVDRNGMSAIQLLDKLGIKEVGMRNMLLSLANSGTLLSDALEMSASAWESNIALLEEANQRYGTTESQIQIMKNALELIKVDLGDFALPKVKDLAGHVVAATKAFLGMDDATKIAMLKMGGLSAAAGPALTAIGGLVGLAGNLVPMLGAVIGPVGILGAGFALFAAAAVDANNDIGKSLEKISLTAKKSLASGNASLAGTMKKVSSRIPAIAGSIVKVIGNTVPGIFQLGFTALTGFADSISANADTIANVGMSIVENVCSGLSEGLPRFIPAAAQMVTGIGSAMISNLPRLVTSIGEVVSSIWDGLKSVDWLGLGKHLLSSLGSAFSGLGEVLSGWFSSAKETLKGMTWSDVAASIKAGITISSDWLKNLIAGDAATDTTTWSGIGKSIWTSIKSGISASGDWLASLVMPANTTFEAGAGWETIGKSVWSKIQSGIKATGDWLVSLVMPTGTTFEAGEGWASVGKSIWAKIQTGITATGDWIKGLILGNAFTADSDWTDVGEKIVSMISSGLSKLDFSAETMAASLTSLGSFVQTFVKNMLENKVEFGTSISTFVTNLVTEISSFSGWTTLATTFGTIATSIIDGIVSAIPTVAAGATNFITAIGSMLSAPATKDFLTAATNAATNIVDSIVQGIPKVVDGAKSIVGAIGTLLSDIDWSLALDSVTSIGESLLKAIVAAIGGVGEFGESVVGAVGTALSNINWEKVTVSLDGFVTMLTNGISEGIAKASDAVSNIVTAIGDWLGQINWEDFADSAKQIGSTLINGMVKGISAALQGASQIADAIADLFQSIDWEEAGTAAADLAGSLFNGLLEGATTITPDVSELLSALGRGISAAGDGLGDTASSIVSSLIQGIVSYENWESLIKTGAVIIDGLVVGMLDLGMGVLEGAAKTIGGVFEGIFIGLGIIPDYSEETKASLQKTIDVVNLYGDELAMSVEWATGNLKTLGGAVSHGMAGTSSEWLRLAMESWTAVSTQGTAELIAQYQEFSWLGVSQITDCFAILTDTTSSEIEQAAAIIALQDLGLDEFIMNATADMNPAVRDAMGETIAYLKGEGIDSFEAAFAMLGITIPEAVRAGLDAGLPLVEAAAAAAVNVASTANERATAEAGASATGKAIDENLASEMEKGTPTVSDASTGVKDAATLALETLPDTAELMGTKATTGMSTSIDNGKSDVITSVETLSTEVVEAALKEMSYETGYDTGRKYVEGMQKGISSLQAAVSAVAATVASNAKNTASSILSFSIGSGIGYQFSNGIAQGIRAGIGLITCAASAAAQAAVTASTSTLDINSPSGVGRDEVGKMWDVGIAEGVWKNSSFIFAAARDVVSSMRDEFLVGDPSRGTVYTSGQTVRQTAKETAASANESKSMLERAKAIGLAIAEELINSGTLEGDFYVDGEKTGRKFSKAVSHNINRDSKKTITGRLGKAVLT